MQDHIPEQPAHSFRVTLELYSRASRLDSPLLLALKEQKENLDLRIISRQALKTLFTESRIQIKGQRARPSSGLAKGTTYVDILGF